MAFGLRLSRSHAVEQPGTAERADRPRPTLFEVIREIAIVGSSSFGSGRQAYFLDAFVRRRGWMTPQEFADGVAFGQLLPGANISNLAVYIGWVLGGLPGAALAWLAILVPGFLAILVAAFVLRSEQLPIFVQGALIGVGAAAVALLTTVIVRTAPPTIRRARGGWIMALAAFVAAGPFQAPLLPTLLVFGAVSLFLNRPRSPS